MELRHPTEHKNIIETVLPGGIAEEVGLVPGDELLSINGQTVGDVIDYRFLIRDEELLLTIKKQDGELWEIDIEKDYDEDLGLDFTNPLIDKARRCSNRCVFCFIDQLPKGMREPLYFKDDDSRLSFLQGNFITLTNLSEDDIERMIRYRIAPINISIHTTNPQLRRRMLGHPRAEKILEILRRFHEAHLPFRGQIVLVPEYNDGLALEETLDDLLEFFPSLESLAIVPVGITKFRENLPDLRTFTSEECKELIQRIQARQEENLKNFGTRLFYLSDEFYLTAGEELPGEEAYEGYPQIENGVGMVRSFLEEVHQALSAKKLILRTDKKILLATGTLAYPVMREVAMCLNEHLGKETFEVVAIANRFFGETITVSGLLTAQDLVHCLKGHPADAIMIPNNMFRSLGDITLDDWDHTQIAKALSRPVYRGSWDGWRFIETIEQVMHDVEANGGRPRSSKCGEINPL